VRWALLAAIWLVIAAWALLFVHAATAGDDEDYLEPIEPLEPVDFDAAVRRLLDEGIADTA
jgi:hypothetical protein